MKLPAFLLLLTYALCPAADPPPEVLLWPDGAPGSEGKTAAEVVVTNKAGERTLTCVHHPSVTAWLPAPDKATGTGVLVIPGGGHRMVCMGHEGDNVARWLADHGVAAFVLKYRLAREEGSTYTIEGEALADSRRAMRIIRSRAGEWQVDPAKLGAVGFSAGGELVHLISQRDGAGDPAAADAADRLNARPAFQGLIYPGRSGDIVPDKDSPPAFLLCSANDRTDISEGMADVYLRFKRAGIPAELHIYSTAGHGFGVRPGATGPAAAWTERFLEWMASMKLLTPKA